MIYQSKPYSCGPASICNACNWVYGNSELCPGEDEILELVEHHLKKTPSDGTDHNDLKRILRHFEIPHYTISYRHRTDVFKDFEEHILNGKAVICHGNEEKHWFVVIGTLFDSNGLLNGLVVVDSANADIVVKTPREKFLTDWCGTEGDKRAYGIVIG